MCDDGQPPAKRLKYNLRSDSKIPEKVPMMSTESTESQSTNTTKILDMNEDCLNEILRYLNVVELCYVSRVCKQLQELAMSLARKKYCDFNTAALFPGRLASSHVARYILSTFGKMIKSMSLQRHAYQHHEAGGYLEERLLKDITEYCGEELKILNLIGFSFTLQAVEELNLLSGSLLKLTLDRSVFVDCVLHLNNFSSLEHLILANSRDCYALMDTYPKLNHLVLNNVSLPSQYMLHHFIVRHRQLNNFVIKNISGVSSTVFRFVGKYLKNLQTFCFSENTINPTESFGEITQNLLRLSELKSLKGLALSWNHLSVGKLLAQMFTNKIALKTLFISRCLNDTQTMETIVQMQHLEDLTFYRIDGLKGEHLVICAQKLTRLKRLTICIEQGITAVVLKEVLRHTKELTLLKIYQSNFKLDSGLYKDVLDIIKDRRNGIKLEIHFLSFDMHVLVPQGTIQANENWLKIKERRNNMN